MRWPAAYVISIALICLAALSSAVGAQERVADYEAEWTATAARAEAAIESNAASTMVMETLRAELVAQREDASRLELLLRERIVPLEEQLDALGEAPEDGQSEEPELAMRRAELTHEIDQARAPMLIAQAEYRRANGLIKEIDTLIRVRFSENLTQSGPTPFIPSEWSNAATTLQRYGRRLVEDTGDIISRDTSRAALKQKAPLALFIAFIGGWMLLGLRRSFSDLLQRTLTSRNGRPSLWVQAFASFARLLVPIAGVIALIFAVRLSGLEGAWSRPILSALPYVAFSIIAAIWLGRTVFGAEGDGSAIVVTTERQERRAYRASLLLGFAYGLSVLIEGLAPQGQFTTAVKSVLYFPIILGAGIALFQLSQILRTRVMPDEDDKDSVLHTILSVLWRLILVVALAAPLLAAIGYLNGAKYLIFPTILTLALLSALRIVYDFVRSLLDRWIEVEAKETRKDQLRLIPILVGFAISFAALPIIALIWGARQSDLTETWHWVNEGISIGESQFSLSDFLVFVVVFAIGYTITRMLQKTVKSSVLPKTRLDSGGRAAIMSGIGYVGIFLAALAAISAAGLDLSSLAIVAGALSVGIGFGLQNIVSNFVSGIILLVERPIKEGDWIAAGGHEGVVRKISVRATLVDTFDRRAVIIPNTDLIAGSVQNYTSPDKTGRVRIPIGVAYGTDPDRVQKVLLDIAEAHPLTLKYPAPAVVFRAFGASSLDFEMRLFLRDINEMLSVTSDINFEISRKFKEEGFEIPFNQNDVNLTNIDEVAAAVVDILQAPTKDKP